MRAMRLIEKENKMSDLIATPATPVISAEPAGEAEQSKAPDAATTEPNDSTETGKETSEGADGLGDAGKKALDAIRADLKAEKARARQFETELQKLRDADALKDKSETEREIALAKQEATREANAKANERILKSDIRAEAKGKLADPNDALVYLKLSEFTADDEGNYDPEDIASAISDLLAKKPYLASKNPVVKFDNGKTGNAPLGQLTKGDLAGMKPEDIVAARKAGRLKSLGIV